MRACLLPLLFLLFGITYCDKKKREFTSVSEVVGHHALRICHVEAIEHRAFRKDREKRKSRCDLFAQIAEEMSATTGDELTVNLNESLSLAVKLSQQSPYIGEMRGALRSGVQWLLEQKKVTDEDIHRKLSELLKLQWFLDVATGKDAEAKKMPKMTEEAMLRLRQQGIVLPQMEEAEEEDWEEYENELLEHEGL